MKSFDHCDGSAGRISRRDGMLLAMMVHNNTSQDLGSRKSFVWSKYVECFENPESFEMDRRARPQAITARFHAVI
jgi:hypothetical protein